LGPGVLQMIRQWYSGVKQPPRAQSATSRGRDRRDILET
jgi:hypothetical protein